jgi:hypothetical protein
MPVDVGETLVTPSELRALLDLPTSTPDAALEGVCAAASHVVSILLDVEKGPHEGHAWDREAAGAVAVQIYGARSAPGGQVVGMDLAPFVSPYLLGPGLTARVNGLIRGCRRTGGLATG